MIIDNVILSRQSEKQLLKSVSVFSPISIGNVSVGFDLLGLALMPIEGGPVGDKVHLSMADSSQTENNLTVTGTHANALPHDKKANIVWACLLEFNEQLEKIHRQSVWVNMVLEKNIPNSSGLGSSACSVVATFYGLNEFYEKPFNQHQLIQMMVKLEGQISGSKHYDNVAPSYLGGLQLIIDREHQITQSLPTFDDCYWLVAYPDVAVSTKAARGVLPKETPVGNAVSFAQNLAGFIDASYRKDKQMAMSFIEDVIAEPHRTKLIPNFDKTRTALLDMNCFAVGISGSGPTIFTVTDDLEVAKKAESWLQQHFLQSSEGFVHICKVDHLGTRHL